MQDGHPDTTDPLARQVLEGSGREEAGRLLGGPSQGPASECIASSPQSPCPGGHCARAGPEDRKREQGPQRGSEGPKHGREQLPGESHCHSALPGPAGGARPPVLVRGVPVRCPPWEKDKCPPRVEEDGGGQASFMPGSVTSWEPCKLPQPSPS